MTHPPPLPATPSSVDDALDVYVIPFGPDRYELFCERQADEVALPGGAEATGVWGRLVQRFGIMLRAAEDREAHPDRPDEGAEGWWARAQAWMMAWVAERVAEQRLLWRLRGKTRVVASHPDDASFDQLLPKAHLLLQSDYERHRRWLVVDVVLLAVSGVLALVPGPNVLAYFFAFRVVGHWMSMRGARHGLRIVQWEGRACPALTRLRDVVRLAPHERALAVQAVANELGLERLPRFVERLSVRR